jgi:putrescine aminotransferase
MAVWASGATVGTSDGGELVDLASGGFGYCDARIVEAVASQMRALPLSSRHFLSAPLAAFVECIAAVAPGDLSVVYPCNSGTEAVEGALKLARGYRRGRPSVVAVGGAYHGATLGALALRHRTADPPVTVVCVEGGDLAAAERAVDERTAAVVVEPVVSAPEVRVFAPGYLAGLRRVCDRAGALLVADEVTTGLGRTGVRFAVERDSVVPDVLVLGGALGGGVLPIAAYVTTRRINDRVYGRRDPVLHSSTTGGNPSACVAALAMLRVLDEDGLEGHCRVEGRRLLAGLGDLARRHGNRVSLGGACGLLASLRLASHGFAQRVQRAALAHGVLVRVDRLPSGAGSLVLTPPLVVSRAELDRGLAALDAALAADV